MSRESDMAQGEGEGRELLGGDGAAWRYKGAVLGSLGRYEEALGAFEKAVEIDEGDGAASMP